MTKTNFDIHLESQLHDSEFREGFERAPRGWNIALQLTKLRTDAGLSQAELADRVGTTQQQISRIESPSYDGHSLRMLRRVARVLNTEIVVAFKPIKAPTKSPKRVKPKPSRGSKALKTVKTSRSSPVRRSSGSKAIAKK